LSEWEEGGPCGEMDYLTTEGKQKYDEIDYENRPELRVKVTPKVNSIATEVLAKHLSTISSTFDITETYNG
jgi:hypothetical protein